MRVDLKNLQKKDGCRLGRIFWVFGVAFSSMPLFLAFRGPCASVPFTRQLPIQDEARKLYYGLSKIVARLILPA